MDLREYITSKSRARDTVFVPKAHYNEIGDFLEIYTEDVRCYAQTISPLLTILRSNEDDRIVGAKIFNVKQAFEQNPAAPPE